MTNNNNEILDKALDNEKNDIILSLTNKKIKRL